MRDFHSRMVEAGADIFVRFAGRGPPVLLLHGFPQTHLMWREVAPGLSREFTVVCPDLRGYGRSGCPPSDEAHTPYSKRAMARDMVAVMQSLGFESFAVVGHDRGGRVAYRLALDHPPCVTRIAVLDIVPTLSAWERADAQFAQAFWPWTLLSQEPPLPETLLTSAAQAIVDHALSGWGSAPQSFPADVRAAYIAALREPAHAHAICEEYRAAATLDRDHDAADRDRGHKIHCPLFALWSAGGALDTWYAEQGGPVALWREFAIDVAGARIDGGHFFPEENPQQTKALLARFLKP
ncbi:MAG TPA: alpha/beta hydrolase [Steroidobacteraceae bacterium]